MKCPSCKSENTHFITNTKSTGPSFGAGCCGALLFGPIGVLCSLCGMSSETEEYWICNSCGNKFQAGDYETELSNKASKVKRLKRDITILEEELKDIPENLQQLLLEANAEYEEAKQMQDDFEREFIDSSNELIEEEKKHTRLYFVAFVLIIIGLIAAVSAFDEGGMTIGILSVIFAIVIVGIANNNFESAMWRVDPQRAEHLNVLKSNCNGKKDTYEELQKIQRKVDSHKVKLNELSVAEKDFSNYSKKE